MSSLRVLVVGKDCTLAERLEHGGHHVTPVDECEIAVEALQLQNFDAVVLGEGVSPRDLDALSREIQQLNRRSNVRTAVLAVQSAGMPMQTSPPLDGYLPIHAGADALKEALANAAADQSARVSAAPDRSTPDASVSDLPVLNPQELREQLDFDDELLLELVNLFRTERERQSPEMREALVKGNLAQLSRVAHTIKGSLGSLQAPAARAEAQLLELAAGKNDRAACERLLPSFERRLDELELELRALTESLVENR